MKDASAPWEIVTDETGFKALEAEWNTLWAHAQGRFTHAFDTCWIAWEQVARPLGRKLHIVVLREAGQPVLIFPLVSYRRLAWRYLIPLCSESSDFTHVLVADSPRASEYVEAAWQIARTRCGADFIHMPYLPDSSDLYRLALKARHPVIRDYTPCYVARLSNEAMHHDWAGFCDSLGPLDKKKPGKVARRLAEAGELRIEVIDASGADDPSRAARIASSIDQLLAWKRTWGERTGKHGHWLTSIHYRNYLVAWFCAPKRAVTTHVIVISFDGAPIAINLLATDTRGVTGLIASFDPDFAKASPGVLAVETAMQWAFEHRLDLDCGAGAERFKAYWARGNLSYCCTVQSVNSWWGLVALRARRGPRGILSRLRALAGRAGHAEPAPKDQPDMSQPMR